MIQHKEDTQLFRTGTIVITPGAAHLLEQHNKGPKEFLDRHVTGDWGRVEGEDLLSNKAGVKDKGMLMSVYPIKQDELWIITDHGHGATTLLLPKEY